MDVTSQQRSEDLAGVVHDLRIPLQALATAAEDVRTVDDAAHIGKLARNVLTRLEDILAGLTNLAPKRQAFAADVVLRDVAALLQPLARGNRFAVRADHAMMWGDPADFSAVVQNLLGNALRFTIDGQVTADLSLNGSVIVLEVRDTGAGLPAEIADFLMSGSEPAGGSHIHGLRIVRDRLARMDARVQVLPSEGTHLRLTFDAIAQDALLPPVTVLVVDDNAVNAGIFAGMVAGLGAYAREAHLGATALAEVEAGGIDAVLLDVSLPDMDGISVASRIRQIGLPIIGITGHGDDTTRQACLAAGMAEVLVKPVRSADLRAALLHHLGAENAMFEGSDLVEELGEAAARSFQQRALDEASRLDWMQEGIAERLHSAVGAAGMTGLTGVERELRRLQARVREGKIDGHDRARLDAVLRVTDAALRGGLSQSCGSDKATNET